MTSAGVSNVSVQIVDAASIQVSSMNNSSSQDFMQVMSRTQSTRQTDENVDQMASSSSSSVTVQKTKESVVKETSEESVDAETTQKISEEVESFDEEVKEAIAEELDVSVEDVEKAMETLGLTTLDLADQTNLVTLVTELTGDGDAVSLLLDDSFSNIKNVLTEMFASLQEETGLDISTLQDIVVEVPETGVEVSFEGMTEVADATALSEELGENVEVFSETAQMSTDSEILQTETATVAETATVVETKPVAETSTTAEAEPTEQSVYNVTESVEQTSGDAQTSSDEQTSSNANNFAGQTEETVLNGETNQVLNTEQTFAEQMQFDPTTSEVTLPSGETVNTSDIIDQIVEYARTTYGGDDSTTVEMLLQPEGLGKVYMEVSEKDGNITAKFYTENESVKQALENQMVVFKEQVLEGNTKITDIEVAVATHEFEKNLEEGQFERQEDEAERQQEQASKRTRNIDLNNLEELSGLMTEEEELVVRMMREGGNTVYYTA